MAGAGEVHAVAGMARLLADTLSALADSLRYKVA